MAPVTPLLLHETSARINVVYASEAHVTSVWGSSLVCDPRRAVVGAPDAESVELRISTLIQVECDNINLVSNTANSGIFRA